jgi:hypothetical protein
MLPITGHCYLDRLTDALGSVSHHNFFASTDHKIMRESNKVLIVNPKGQGLKHFYITSSSWSLGGRMPFLVLCPCLLYSEQPQNNKQHYRLVDCHASRRLSVLLVRRYLSHFLHYQYLVFNCSANMSPPNFHSDCIADTTNEHLHKHFELLCGMRPHSWYM